MSDNRKVALENIQKAISDMKDVVKGHADGGSPNTRVATMQGEGGATQVHHTPSNSDPGGWAGSTGKECPGNGADDNVAADGTDYVPDAGGVFKSVMDQVAAGNITADVGLQIIKGMMAYAKKKDDQDMDKAVEEDKDLDKAMDEEDQDDDEESEPLVKKSLAESVAEDETVSAGLEVSDILKSWSDSTLTGIEKSIDSVEKRVSRRLAKSDAANAEYQAGIAKALSSLSQVLKVQSQRLEQLEGVPGRGPKSVGYVEKSFAGAAPEGEKLAKSQILETMVTLAQSGEIPASEVIRFESTGDVSPGVYQQVCAHRSK